MKRGRSEDALDLHVRALSRAKKVDDVQLAARTYNNMGYIFGGSATNREPWMHMERWRIDRES